MTLDALLLEISQEVYKAFLSYSLPHSYIKKKKMKYKAKETKQEDEERDIQIDGENVFASAGVDVARCGSRWYY